MKVNGLKVLVSFLVLSSMFLMGQYFYGLGNARMTHIVSKIWFNFEGKEEEGKFNLVPSKFGFKDEKKMPKEGSYFDVIPDGLGDSSGDSKKSMMVKAAFTRKGYNYVDIIPEKKQEPFPGIIRTFDMWVWGGNFDYSLEVHMNDYEGFKYTIQMGNLRYYGWRNLNMTIPSSIRQGEPYAPRRKGLTFDKFRIYAAPHERHDRFHTFFDYAKIVTDTYRDQYDGWELEKLIANDIEDPQPVYDGIKENGQNNSPANNAEPPPAGQ